MSVEVALFGMRKSRRTHLIPDVCSCHVLRILAVAVCKIGDVCCLPAPAHQPFSSYSSLRKRLCIHSVISVNYHYITVLCPFNLLIRFECYNTVKNKFKRI